MKRRWLWAFLGIVGIAIVLAVVGALWFQPDPPPVLQKASDDHVKRMRFTDAGTLLYVTRHNEVKRLNVGSGSIETAAEVNGYNVRLDPSGTYAGHVEDGKIRITSIEPDRAVRELNGSVYTWQDDSTIMYLKNQKDGSIFIEEGQLTRYHFETDSRDQLTQIAGTAIHPITSYSGFVLTAAGEEVSENARLTLYSDRQDPEVVVSDQAIQNTRSGSGLMLFQTRDTATLKHLNRHGRVESTELEPVGDVYRPIDDDTIAAEIIYDNRRVIALYDVTEAVIESTLSLRDIGEVTDVAASGDFIAVTTTDGLYVGEL